MSTAVWQLVRVGPEVGDPGDLAVVSEIEEAQAGLRALPPANSIQLAAFWPSPTIRCTVMCQSYAKPSTLNRR